ncbi:PHP domain-containing protein [Natroniella sulfidigena]|uniref:PHP domain-containing protein n=1 Tax=Natroniella sulfidigena TaxID=723921 RepID=UPI00200A2734|nr:PHP domain-containing protein [Natroniella sulfidigena]MCK8817699.1 PHP domain-containing protein [Natroniella sulfidigena]
MDKYIDLHLHTTASDGSFTPTEVVRTAKSMGFSAIAITDHDTLAGLEEGARVAKEEGIEFVPGIELNTDYDDTEIHVLGYYLDYGRENLLNKLDTLQKARYNRIKNMVDKLNGLGFDIEFEEITDIAEDAALGRPHIAQVMLDKGYVKEWSQAFDQYIGCQGPAYVKRKKLTAKEAIQLIKSARGIPIIAHPVLIGNDQLLPKLVEWGAEGFEVYHTEHDQAATRRYLEFAKQNDLLITGGSDCHGPKRKGEILLGEIKAPYKLLNRLKQLKKQI